MQSRRHTAALLCQRAATALFLGAILLGGRARAIEPVGDDAGIFVTGTATIAENDNVFLSHSNATSATIFDLVPGLSYEFGKANSQATGQLAAYEDFQFFSGTSKSLNNQLGNIVFALKYDDTKSKITADASYHNVDQAQVGIQNVPYLVDRNLIHADLTDEVSITDKSSVSGGLVFDDTDYRALGFTDWRYTEIPVNYYYQVEPKLDLSAGFRYRTNTLGAGGIDSTDYYYNVGARGEFTPSLTGEFDIGYNRASLATGVIEGGLGADSSFTYAYDPKTSVKFGFNDDYGYAATSFAYRNYGPYVAVNSILYDQWTAGVLLSYNRYSYLTTSQRDNFYSGQLSVTYKVTLNITATATYTYSEDSSNLTADSFTDNSFSVSASLHF